MARKDKTVRTIPQCLSEESRRHINGIRNFGMAGIARRISRRDRGLRRSPDDTCRAPKSLSWNFSVIWTKFLTRGLERLSDWPEFKTISGSPMRDSIERSQHAAIHGILKDHSWEQKQFLQILLVPSKSAPDQFLHILVL